MPESADQSTSTLTEKDLSAWATLARFREALAIARKDFPDHRSFKDPKRLLQLGDYLCLFLLGLLNPIARSMRGLIQASRLPKVQREICTRKVSLGSFSETQALVDVALLERVFADLSAQLPDRAGVPAALRTQRWMARDSSLFAALPRMTWALYGGGREGCLNNAVRLHVSLDLKKDSPSAVQITPGKKCERAALRENLVAGDAYIGDRYYGEHHAFFTLLSRRGNRYLIRLLHRGMEPTILEELPVSEADKAAGIQRQAMVRLGKNDTLSEVLRHIWLRGINGQELLLVTNLRAGELSAADAALLYQHRWQIEYFFRWLKCLMGCGHWLAESQKGAGIQLYLALIGAVLLELDLGRRPSKRVWELLQWYLSGTIGHETLAELLKAQLTSEEYARARRNKKRR